MKTGKPIVPIMINGSAKVLAKGDPCFKTIKKSLIEVTMFQPLYPENFKNEIDMLEYTHSILRY
jgi:1-acyl-sn-glycerol-3-phosphate acyltransferase